MLLVVMRERTGSKSWSTAYCSSGEPSCKYSLGFDTSLFLAWSLYNFYIFLNSTVKSGPNCIPWLRVLEILIHNEFSPSGYFKLNANVTIVEYNFYSFWGLFLLTTGPRGLNNRDLKDFLSKSTNAFAIYKTNRAFENYIFHLPLQVWDHHLRFSFLPWKKLKAVHPCCKGMWELPDFITTGTGMSAETRWAGDLHQSLVVLHQP